MRRKLNAPLVATDSHRNREGVNDGVQSLVGCFELVGYNSNMADEAQSETVEVPENTKGNKTRTLPEEAKPFMWKPGESGNPGGRPKKKPLTEAYEALMKQPIPGDSQGRTFAEAIAFSMATEAIKGKSKVSAASEIADRVEGRVLQQTEISGPDGGAIQAAITVEFVRPKPSE